LLEVQMPSSSPAEPIRVVVVDDHPALREGLLGLLELEDDFVAVAAVSSERELFATLLQTRPDVIILDYALGRGNGLKTCFRVKQLPRAPGVVLYSAYVDSVFNVPAGLAQADAIVSKSAPVDELLDAVRNAARGITTLPQPDPEAIQAASARLRADDYPVVGLLFAREPLESIAATLDLERGEVQARALRIIGVMQPRERAPLEGSVR
jgi:DNA-binding NarL/FixJ family response regulator